MYEKQPFRLLIPITESLISVGICNVDTNRIISMMFPCTVFCNYFYAAVFLLLLLYQVPFRKIYAYILVFVTLFLHFQGELIGITGRVGSGKTSLFASVIAETEKDSGYVCLFSKLPVKTIEYHMGQSIQEWTR